jgi:tripartite-type tricarboxylate transporter receptor subunit TctC
VRFRKLLAAGAALLAALVFSASGFAQAWPERPVRIVVPFAPGGNTDSIARITAERLTQALGKPFIVENRPGAAGVVAAEYVARAAPDGYILFMSIVTQMAIAPLISKVSYDPIRDFAPISIIGTNPFVIAISSSVPANTLPEFVAYAKANPGKLNYASAGAGSLTHLSATLFVQRAGLQMAHVPYKGGAPALNDLLGGQVHMYSGSPSELLPHAAGGRIRLLAVSSTERSKHLPELPAIAEFFPGHVALTWNGLLAPANTPAPVIDRLSKEVQRAMRDPTFVDRLDKIGVDPVLHAPADFAKTIQRDLEMWREVAGKIGLRPE